MRYDHIHNTTMAKRVFGAGILRATMLSTIDLLTTTTCRMIMMMCVEVALLRCPKPSNVVRLNGSADPDLDLTEQPALLSLVRMN